MAVTKSKSKEVAKATKGGKVNTKKVEGWAIKIENAYVKSIQSLVQVGKYLIEAKKDLTAAEFDSLLKDELRFAESKASKFMKIAGHKILTHPDNLGDLPAEPSIVYELTLLDDKTLTKALNKGTIHPDMSLKEAVDMRGDTRKVHIDRAGAEDAEEVDEEEEDEGDDEDREEDEEPEEDEDEKPTKGKSSGKEKERAEDTGKAKLPPEEAVIDNLSESLQSVSYWVGKLADEADKNDRVEAAIKKTRVGKDAITEAERLIKTLTRLVNQYKK